MVISLFMYVFSSVMEFQTDSKAQLQSSQITAFNRFFVEVYDLYPNSEGIQIKGHDVYNIIRKVDDLNDSRTDTDITIEEEYNGISAESFRNGDIVYNDNMDNTYTYQYTLGSDGYVRKITFNPFSG